MMAGAGVATGLGALTTGAGQFGTALQTFANQSPTLFTALNGAAANALTQGIADATDLQNHFSWRNVAISSLATPVAGAVGVRIEAHAGPFAGYVASGLGGSLVRRALGSRENSATILADAFGNALGNSIVAGMGRSTPTGARASNAGTTSDATDALPTLGAASGTTSLLNNATDSAYQPATVLSPDEQRNLAANQPDPVAVMELQQALAQEEFERANGNGGWSRDADGAFRIEITRGANALSRAEVSASTNASFYGITDAVVDADIAAGKTGALDAIGYAGRVLGYELHNFFTAGFVKRHDERLIAEASGQLSSQNFLRATTLDAVGSVGSLYLGGRAGSYALNRLGTGYAGYMGSGAAGGAMFDLAQQGTQLGINAITAGQTGQEQFSLNELAIATSGGALLGGAIKLGSGYNVRSPIYLDLQQGAVAYSGVPIGVRSPFVAETAESGATFGGAASTNYRATFFGAYPELEGQVVVHHAVEQQVLTRFPGVATKAGIHSLENLRGIPKTINSEVHLSQIRREWNQFYRQNPSPTTEQLLQKATEIDVKFGSRFQPSR